jgi:SPP1 family predicted phage head-tail adaptor
MPITYGSNAAKLDRRIDLQRRTPVRSLTTGGQRAEWVTYATVMGELVESTSSRAPDERANGEVNLYGRPSAVKIRWRSDVTVADRIVYDNRVMQIIGTAEVGRRRWLELAIREWSHE